MKKIKKNTPAKLVRYDEVKHEFLKCSTDYELSRQIFMKLLMPTLKLLANENTAKLERKGIIKKVKYDKKVGEVEIALDEGSEKRRVWEEFEGRGLIIGLSSNAPGMPGMQKYYFVDEGKFRSVTVNSQSGAPQHLSWELEKEKVLKELGEFKITELIDEIRKVLGY